MYGSTPEIAHGRIDGCVGAICPVGLDPVGPDGQGSVQACLHFPESVWVEVAADGNKTTTNLFYVAVWKLLKDTVCNGCRTNLIHDRY
jgi:hypothetical protein